MIGWLRRTICPMRRRRALDELIAESLSHQDERREEQIDALKRRLAIYEDQFAAEQQVRAGRDRDEQNRRSRHGLAGDR